MGRTAVPVPDPGSAADRGWPAVDLVGGHDPVVVTSVPGGAPVSALASDLLGRGLRPMWARLAPHDLDGPALAGLARAVLGSPPARAGAGAGSTGPGSEVGTPAVVVVESPDESRARALLAQLGAGGPDAGHREGLVLHLVEAGPGDGGAAPAGSSPLGPDPVPEGATEGGPLQHHPEARRRLEALLAGRPGLLDGVARTARLAGEPAVARAVLAAASAEELTRGLVAVLLGDTGGAHRRDLRLAALLGYAHPDLGVFAPVLADTATHPWWVPLDGGWFQVDPAWRAALGDDPAPLPVAAVARVVGDLVDASAAEEALELCLDAACPGLASDLLAELAPDLLDAGRTRALERWLSRLPPQETARHAALAARLGDPPGPASTPPAGMHVRHRRWWRARGESPREPDPAPAELDPGPLPARPAILPPAPRPPRPPAPLTVSVRLLGSIEVQLEGRPVQHWHGRVGRTALAYVLLQRRRVPPEELAGALWPDAPEATARNRLHVALHRLRGDLAAVDPRPVLVHEQGYAVHPGAVLDLDVEHVERLAGEGGEALRAGDPDRALARYLAALDWYRGDLLAGERDEEWALLAREHYRVRLLDVLGKAAQLALDVDRPAQAVDLGQRLLALDFCREDLHRLLMRAYARLGQPQLALRQYQTCVRQMRLEFGLDPAPPTVELFDQIRCQLPV